MDKKLAIEKIGDALEASSEERDQRLITPPQAYGEYKALVRLAEDERMVLVFLKFPRIGDILMATILHTTLTMTPSIPRERMIKILALRVPAILRATFNDPVRSSETTTLLRALYEKFSVDDLRRIHGEIVLPDTFPTIITKDFILFLQALLWVTATLNQMSSAWKILSQLPVEMIEKCWKASDRLVIDVLRSTESPEEIATWIEYIRSSNPTLADTINRSWSG